MNRQLPAILFCALCSHGALASDNLPDDDTLEAQQYVVGSISLQKANVFDLDNPAENGWLYRTANRLHVLTRDKTIRKQLLFTSGDLYDKRLIEESERLLRRNKYLYDAQITATRATNGTVDLVVETKDVFSMSPEVALSRGGGETRWRFGLEEDNLLGRGQQLSVFHEDDIERNGNTIEFSDRTVGTSWVSLLARYSDNSDGETQLLSIARPFYALDTRWSAGGSFLNDDLQNKLYQYATAAAEYRHERQYAHLFGGWSRGLNNGKVLRWTAGFVRDDNDFSSAPDSTLPSVVPEDRKLVYPYFGFELVEDGYVTARNRDQIDKTEDFQMGLQLRGSLGWASTELESDRNAAVFFAGASHGFGSVQDDVLLLSASTSGRLESGDLANTLLSLSARYYRRQSERSTFYAAISGTAGNNLDLDNPVALGGTTGMRGYPFNYQVGESKLLATIEQRHYTDWYPFRLARVGTAVFFDAGRVWGPNPLGADNRDWIADIGFGVRLAMTRIGSGRVVHIDFAFPLNSDATIDKMQVLIEAKRSF